MNKHLYKTNVAHKLPAMPRSIDAIDAIIEFATAPEETE